MQALRKYCISIMIFCLYSSIAFAGSVWTTYTTDDGLVDNRVNSVIIDADGNKWFGTWNGISKYDGTTWTNYTTDDGMVGDAVGEVAIDHNGNVWATSMYGVNMYDGTTWINYTTDDGLVDNIVGSIIVDNDNNIWVTSIHGVSKFDGSIWTTYTTDDGLLNNWVGDVKVDQDGIIWFATSDGVSSFDGLTWENYTTDDGLVHDTVYTVAVDSDNNKWFGTYGGASKFDGSTWKSYTQSLDGLADNWIYAIAVEESGVAWFGHNRGASKLDGGKWTNYTPDDGLARDWVQDIAIDIDGSIWFSTTGGVSRYQGYKISGMVYEPNGEGIAHVTGVTFTLSGDEDRTFTAPTYKGGYYTFDDLAEGNYTVTPSREGLEFNPPKRDYTPLNSNMTEQDFVTNIFEINGMVKDIYGKPIEDVLVTLSGDSSDTYITFGSGIFAFIHLVKGDYTITPSKEGYTFTPSELMFNPLSSDISEQDFIGSNGTEGEGHYVIRGYIHDSKGNNIEEVTVTLSGADTGTTITTYDGYYEFPNLIEGEYSVTPIKDGCDFVPSKREYSSLVTIQSDEDFSAGHHIKGYIKDDYDNGIEDVTVTLAGIESKTYLTSYNGYYEFSMLSEGQYTVTPTKAGYTFTLPERYYSFLDYHQTEQNFSGAPQIPEGTNSFKPVNNLFKPDSNEKTTLYFSITQSGNVTITIYTLDGILVKTVCDEHKDAGVHNIDWDGKNDDGDIVASGLYFVVINAPALKETKKVCVVR